jgi:hypothetical protein
MSVAAVEGAAVVVRHREPQKMAADLPPICGEPIVTASMAVAFAVPLIDAATSLRSDAGLVIGDSDTVATCRT